MMMKTEGGGGVQLVQKWMGVGLVSYETRQKYADE